ncbi:arginine-hydroxylase NDUFAF5, mitochondrial [Toxorhynchites rutilus septentrionalis]|uniref:arginine-hydroxylase NDUFAF5, mitochondrial n=1 Tax=Toxorhynchites rutilus septentrionalis TaxID=329112 RepID=UPI00247ABF76|nr:arginine-hydroxylase NDUFAF5, mitochondrial [Toxorhynchites rutilus septentrionalis]
MHSITKRSVSFILLPYNRKYCISAVNIFDRNVKRIQRERAAKREDVQLYDYIKEEVGYRLSDRIFDVKRQFKNVVDLGASRGYVANHVLGETVAKLTAVDLSPTMLSQIKGTPGLDFSVREMDEEKFDFGSESLDLVVSSLSLHWVNDLPACFKAVNKALQPDGVFMGAMFGGETLYELRSSLQLAEQERRGGLSPHLSPFTEIRDVGMLLNRSNFTMLTIDTDEIVVGYPSMFELMWDLKGMAESNASFSRPLRIDRETLMAAAAIYKDMYAKDDGVTATFQVIYFVGWKPCPSQPKPLERGSATASLKDLGKLIDPKQSK